MIRVPESVCPSNPNLGSATLSVTNNSCFALPLMLFSLLYCAVPYNFSATPFIGKRRYDVSHTSLRPSLIVPMLLSLSLLLRIF